MQRLKRYATLVFSLVLMLAVLAACGGGDDAASEGGQPSSGQTSDGGASGDQGETGAEGEQQEEPYALTFMMPSYETELPDESSPVIQELEKRTNTDITLQFVPNSSYGDKMNITIASGDIPTLMVVDQKSPSFINAARTGAFWELGPYLQDYPNLKQTNEVVLNNVSIDGKIYAIPRMRTLGRNGVSYRKDWLDNVGLEEPKTIDDFYNMLKAFKEEDPDQDGQDDTYGLVVTKYAGPWDIMQLWFGVPNKWGKDENGDLLPAHMFPEYMDALNFFKKLYDEGLVNSDFAVMDPAKWDEPIVNGEAGVKVDVADAAQRIEDDMVEIDPGSPRGSVGVFGGVEGPEGLRILPTTGYNGMIAVSKTAVETEEELRKVLTFLDRLNDEENQILLANGIEGRHFELVDGYTEPAEDPAIVREVRNLNQMLMFIPEDRTIPVYQTEIRKKVREVQKANEEYVVPNPAEPLVSDVYARLGQQLDNIVADARVQYIVGQIDEAGVKDAHELWLQNGGQDYIDEINQLYDQAQQNAGK